VAELFEPDGSGIYSIPTADYAVPLSGQLALDLGGGDVLTLGTGGVAVQCGTHHAWRNRTHPPATGAFVLVGADLPAGDPS
jgi:hypothetical protein